MGYPHLRGNGENEGEGLLEEEMSGADSEMGEAMERRGQDCLLAFFFLLPQLPSSPTPFPSSCDILIRTDSPGRDRGHIPGMGDPSTFQKCSYSATWVFRIRDRLIMPLV